MPVVFNIPPGVLEDAVMIPVVVTVAFDRVSEVAEFLEQNGAIVRRVSVLTGIIVADVPVDKLREWMKRPEVLARLGVISVSYEYPLKTQPVFFR